MRMAPGRKLIAGFALALTILVVNAFVSYRNTRDLVNNGFWVVHTREVLNLLDGFASSIKDAQASQRAYLITGDGTEVAAFDGVAARARDQIARLREATADNADQQARVAELERATGRYLGRLREANDLRHREGFEAARRDFESGIRRESFEAVHSIIEATKGAEANLLYHRTKEARASIWRAVSTFTLASLLALTLLGGVFLLIRRYLAETDRAAASLRASEGRVRLLLDSTGEGIYGIDPTGRCTFCNVAALKMFGYDDAAAVLGQDMHALVHHSRPDGTPFSVADCGIYKAALRNESHHDEDVFWRADGSNFPVEYRSHPIRLGGQTLGAVVTFTDIAGRRASEETMRLRDRALRAIAQGIFITDPTRSDEPITYVNAAFVRLTGYDQGEVEGRDVRFLRGPETDPDALEDLKQAFRAGHECSVELLFYHKDGTQFWASLAVSPVHSPSGRVTHFVGVLTDVTERKRAEEELQRAKETAEGASRSKSTFLANMSHELRTPLNAIIGYSEMLKEEADDLGREDFAEDLGRIHAAGKHLLGLINDVLDLSKIEAGKMDLYLETFDAAEMIRGVVDTIEPLAEKSGDHLEIECGEGLGSMHADLTKVRQALLNLLSNAVKFTERGTIRLLAAREAEDGRDWITLDVRDSGIGMTPEQLGRLFQPFTQADASTTRKYGGTGLGLTITRRFCQMMGGDITVRSEPGAGSTFTIRLPAQVAGGGGGGGGLVESPHTPRSAEGSDRGPLVLVVDDDAAVRDLMGRLLAREGFRVAYAVDGESALRLARRDRPEVITLDVMMPGLDGWAVLTELKSDPDLADIPVIMVTFVGDRNLGYALGASDYLTKPIDRSRLSAILKKYRAGLPGGLALIVDDDESARRLIRQMMEEAGWNVEEAEDGRVGLERVEASPPDLIILDLTMPNMDGFDFANTLRRRREWRDVPILVVTSRDLSAEDRARLNGQVQAVIQKGSYTRDELLAEIRHEVSGRARRRPAASSPVEGPSPGSGPAGSFPR